ncbi:MAG: low molecular weight protein tyrosine phosphatase family protein [Aureispira sp.]
MSKKNDALRILFICSQNKWRSRTAEHIFKNKAGWNVRSAGTDRAARVRLNANHVNWAEVIFVMEDKHKNRLKQHFRPQLKEQEIIVLDIPDDYQYLDPELIEMLEKSVHYYLEED